MFTLVLSTAGNITGHTSYISVRKASYRRCEYGTVADIGVIGFGGSLRYDTIQYRDCTQKLTGPVCSITVAAGITPAVVSDVILGTALLNVAVPLFVRG